MSTAVIFTKVKDSCIFKKGQDSQSTDSNPHSSMETVPTDFIDGDFSEEDDADETPWARLMPLGEGFVTVGMHGLLSLHHQMSRVLSTA